MEVLPCDLYVIIDEKLYMDLSKYRNGHLIRNEMRDGNARPVDENVRPVMVRPGVWFQAFLTVIFVPFWLPVVLNIFRYHELAQRVIVGCMSCNKRKKMMDREGWLGLPKLLVRKEFWTRNKFGWLWSRNRITITS